MIARAAIATLILMIPGGCRDVGAPRRENGNGAGNGVSADVVVTVDTTLSFQTMTGWQTVATIGQDGPRDFRLWEDDVIEKGVNELGINRVQLAVRTSSENPTDYHALFLQGQAGNERCERWLMVNDNADPRVLNPSGFHWTFMDSAVVHVVLPMKKKLEARGEKLYVNLNYVSFLAQCGAQPPPFFHSDPAEYAEFMVAAFLHLKETFGFVPDAIEMVLEPDNGVQWTGTSIGRAIVATAERLAEHGFRPAFIGPSTTNMGSAIAWGRAMLAVPGVAPLLSEISFHRYSGVSQENLRGLAQLAAEHGKKTSMLEHIGSGVDDLYEDLTIGNVSAWEQFTLGMGAGRPDGGGQYYRIIDNQAQMTIFSRYLRQYFHYVRFGAVRVAATSSPSGARVTAFKHATRGLVIVLHTTGTETVAVKGLAPGRYGVSGTTDSVTGGAVGDYTVSGAGTLQFTSPGAGVVTVYRK